MCRNTPHIELESYGNTMIWLYHSPWCRAHLYSDNARTLNSEHIYIVVYTCTCTRTIDGPRSAVGNVSGYRCVSDCRSRGREFDPGPVPYFRGD